MNFSIRSKLNFLLQCTHNLLCRKTRALISQNHAELISARSSDQSIRKRSTQIRRNAAQCSIARKMPIKIINQLEIIQIQEYSSQLLCLWIRNPLVQMKNQSATIRDSCKGILISNLLKFPVLIRQFLSVLRKIMCHGQDRSHRHDNGADQNNPKQHRDQL